MTPAVQSLRTIPTVVLQHMLTFVADSDLDPVSKASRELREQCQEVWQRRNTCCMDSHGRGTCCPCKRTHLVQANKNTHRDVKSSVRFCLCSLCLTWSFFRFMQRERRYPESVADAMSVMHLADEFHRKQDVRQMVDWRFSGVYADLLRMLPKNILIPKNKYPCITNASSHIFQKLVTRFPCFSAS